MPVRLKGDPRPNHAKGKFAKCVEILRQQRLENDAIWVNNQAIRIYPFLTNRVVRQCPESRLRRKRAWLRKRFTAPARIQLRSTAERRGSQFDLGGGGNRELRRVWIVGVCRRLGIAHAGAQSLKVTHTNTRHLIFDRASMVL